MKKLFVVLLLAVIFIFVGCANDKVVTKKDNQSSVTTDENEKADESGSEKNDASEIVDESVKSDEEIEDKETLDEDNEPLPEENTQPETCGNGAFDPGEECEPGEEKDCSELGFDRGVATCLSDCSGWEESECGSGSVAFSCEEIDTCIDKCRDEECPQACYDQGSEEGKQLYMQYYQCYRNSGCQDMECVEQNCGEEKKACLSGTSTGGTDPGNGGDPEAFETCNEILDCMSTTSGFQGISGCYQKGSSEAQSAFQPVFDCAQQSGCMMQQDMVPCVEQNCGEQVEQCNKS